MLRPLEAGYPAASVKSQHLTSLTVGRLRKTLHHFCYPIQIHPCNTKTVETNMRCISPTISTNTLRQRHWSWQGELLLSNFFVNHMFILFSHFTILWCSPCQTCTLQIVGLQIGRVMSQCPISLVVLYFVKICCVYKLKPQTQTIPDIQGYLPQCHGNTSNINRFLHHQTPNKDILLYNVI